MKIHALVLATLTLSSLTACVVYDDHPGRSPGPKHVYYYDRDYDRHDYDWNRDHCPPGHRKKGWC